VDFITRAVQIAKQVDGPVKVIWTREEDIQHDIYRPYYFDRLGGLMLVIGWARLAAVPFLFIIPTTPAFHAFWSVDPEAAQDQMIQF
jgi:hypothetical protein